MNNDFEAQMAKALEGQFFWEHTTDSGHCAGEFSDEIRRAQRKFFVRPKSTYGEKTKLERERLAALAAKRLAMAEFVKAEIAPEIKFMRDFVADLHKVEAHEIAGEGRMKKVVIARHHFVWSLVRYYPDISIAELGRQINKHHTTILHSRNYFEKVKGVYKDFIDTMDEVFLKSSRFSPGND